MSDWLFDGPLAGGLLLLAWLTVSGADLFRAVILFIAFGLLMALCWARLAAPDVALAEAAIGAGITGALVLNAQRVLSAQKPPADPALPWPLKGILAVLITAAMAGLGFAFMRLPEPAIDLAAAVRAQLAESGVSNSVTAVLLNFRAYDTLLEVAVLLLALLGVWTVNRQVSDTPPGVPAAVFDSELLDTLVRLLTPLAVLVGAYLLWAGGRQPGGAFQAGSVLGAGGILLLLSNRLRPAPVTHYALRLGLSLGLWVFSVMALGFLISGGTLLEYPREQAGLLILLIEAALTLSIALTLTLLVSGSPGLRRGEA